MLRRRRYLAEKDSGELYQDGRWVTFRGRKMFIGGVAPDERPEKPEKPVGRRVEFKRKDGTTAIKHVYPEEWVARQTRYKFAVMAALAANVDNMDRALDLEMARKGRSREKAAATAIKIMLTTGMRVGDGKVGTGKSRGGETFGVTTLERRHVRISGDKVEFAYRGKSGVDHHHVVTGRALADSVREFMGGKDVSDSDKPLFSLDGPGGVLHRKDASARLKKFDPDYKPKDLRTLKANEIASDVVSKILGSGAEPPEDAKGKKRFVQSIISQIGDAVAKELGNTKSVAIASYVSPFLIEAALAELGVK